MSKKNTPAGGLKLEKELKHFEAIRAEFTTPVFKPRMILDHDSLTFNSACVRLFPDSEYVQILADPKKRLLALWCDEHDKVSVKWSKIKNGRPRPRIITARILCAKIFEMMKWNIQYRYRIMAVHQELEGYRFYLFNLEECEMYVPDEEQLDDNDSGRKKRSNVFPLDWPKTFGTPCAELESTDDADLKSMCLLYDHESEDMTEKPETHSRAPTTRELITREYFAPDDIVAKGRKKK